MKAKILKFLGLCFLLGVMLFAVSCKGNKGENTSTIESSSIKVENGKSAYEIWLKNGNEGTEQDFLNWLKGTQGENGADGVGISSVEVGENGNLIITLTNGTTQEISMPSGGVAERESDLHFMRIAGKNEYRVVGMGMQSDIDVVIPSTYKGLPVTEIWQGAFEPEDGNESEFYIRSIVIPDSVTVIGESAFAGCCNLRKVTIGSGVAEIRADAFVACEKLIEVINKSSHITVEKGSEELGEIGLNALEVFNSGDEYVNKFTDDNGFVVYSRDGEEILVYYEGGDKDVVIPNYVTKINDIVFEYNTNIKSVVIPDSVTTIGERAFSSCYSLTSVEIGDSVTSIGSAAFYNCTALTEIKYNATSCEDLSGGNGVFYNAGQSGEGIKVTIGANVKKIPAYLFNPFNEFYYSPNITSVVFEEGSVCESIGEAEFTYCSSLIRVEIPDSVTIIGDYAFICCASLTSIDVGDGNTTYKSIEGNLYTKDGKTLIQYAVGKTDAEFVIPDSVTSIGEIAFLRCASLTGVVIGNSVTSIGDYAFYFCESLTSIEIPDSVTRIGAYAFYNCDSLTSVTFKDTSTWYTTLYDSYTKGSQIDVTDASRNATKLKANGYAYYYWYKE